MSFRKKLYTVVWLGGVVASLDILAAVTHAYIARGTSPVIVLQYIASGALGGIAFEGGMMTAVVGLLFHYFIATFWTAAYLIAYPRVAILRRIRLGSGIGYGLFVWLMMNLVVVPMSRIPARPLVLQNVAIGALILIAMVGLPIAFIVSRTYEQQARTSPRD